MTNDYMLINVLQKIEKMKGIDVNDDTKILIGTDGKLPDDISFQKIVILMNLLLKMTKVFIRNYFQKKHCMMNELGNNT